jgi:DNA invertase Pin-like site-specific DNA recombinase
MSIYAYLRVSTDTQDVNSQRIGIEEFCKAREWAIDEWVMDEGISGAKDPSKRKLGGLLKKCKSGDSIIASEISRMGRKLVMILDIIKLCSEKGVKVYTVKDRYTLEDTIQSKVLVTVMGLAAEIERDLLRQRTKEGLKRAVAAGKHLGRKKGVPNSKRKLDGKGDYIARKLAEKTPICRIARSLHVHPVTITRWRKQHA